MHEMNNLLYDVLLWMISAFLYDIFKLGINSIPFACWLSIETVMNN